MTNLSVKSCIVSLCHYQDGDSALMMAAREGRTEVVSLLLEAVANTDLQNKVKLYNRRCGFGTLYVPSHRCLTHTFLSPHSMETLH